MEESKSFKLQFNRTRHLLHSLPVDSSPDQHQIAVTSSGETLVLWFINYPPPSNTVYASIAPLQ